MCPTTETIELPDIRDAAQRANLKPRHIAKMAGVSRVTASLWLNDHTNPHPLLRDKIVTLVSVIEAGLKSGDFPIPSELNVHDGNARAMDAFRELSRRFKKAS